MTESIRYAARVPGVQELTLRGTADGDYWKRFLAPAGLSPECAEDRARLMIVGGRLRWRGFSFREISFLVELEPQPDSKFEGASLLLHAFNSNPFFAFAERLFFSTPYLQADCGVDVQPPRNLSVRRNGKPLFSAGMPATTPERPPLSNDVPDNFGPVYLLPQSGGRPSRYFVARIEGDGFVIPWDPASDTLDLDNLGAAAEALRHLSRSGFTPVDWTVRQSAFHGKSFTRRIGAELP